MASISLEGEQPKGVLGRLQAREAQRAAEAARRAEAQQGSADPRESVDAFLDAFGTQRQALETAVQGLGAGAGANEADAAAAVDGLAAELAELDKEVSAAAYYLPAYDLRQATLAVGALKEQLDAARVALQPRKKFSFSRRGAAKPVCEQPAAAASGGVRAGAPTAAAAAGSVPAAATGDSQQLGDSGAPSTSGRCALQPPCAAPDPLRFALLLCSCLPLRGQQLTAFAAPALLSYLLYLTSWCRTISGLSGQVVVEAREAVAGLDVTLSDLQVGRSWGAALAGAPTLQSPHSSRETGP